MTRKTMVNYESYHGSLFTSPRQCADRSTASAACLSLATRGNSQHWKRLNAVLKTGGKSVLPPPLGHIPYTIWTHYG